MAIDLTPSASYTRAGLTGVVSIGGWLRLDVLPVSGLQYNVVAGRDNGANDWGQLETDNEGGSARLNIWSNNLSDPIVSGPFLTLVTWYYAIFSLDGTAWTLRYRAEGETSLTTFTGTGSGVVAANNLRIAREAVVDAATTFAGALEMWRVYQSVLSEADALAESASETPLVTVWADYPFENTTNDTSDVSGNGRDLTFAAGTGSVANTTGPNIGIGIDEPIAAATQSTVAQPLGRAKARPLQPVSPATVVQPLTARKRLALGTVSVPSGVEPLNARKRRPLGTASAAADPGALGRAKRRTLSPATSATDVRPLTGPPEPATGDVTIEIGPSRVGSLAIAGARTGTTIGPSRVRERVTVGPSRTGVTVDESRVRERVELAGARIRERVEVGESRIGTVTVGPSRTNRGA